MLTFLGLILSLVICILANGEEDFPIHQAARAGDLNSLKNLIRRMSDEQVIDVMKRYDNFGYHPLHRAVKNGH